MSNDENEDWEKAYWAKRAQQIQQQKPQQQPQYTPPQGSGNTREIDAANIFAQRSMMGQAQGQGRAGAGSVFLREGVTYYRQIPNPDGFGTTMPLVRSMGPLTQVTGKEFMVCGDIRGYCIDNLPSIDLSKVNEQPDRMLNLVQVKAPFVGNLLVPKSAIIEISQNGGKQLLRG